MVGVLERMQAPRRDKETKKQWEEMQGCMLAAEAEEGERPGAFCKALEFVLDRVNSIRIDAANTRLRMIAPVIKIHGVEYERAHMEKKLKGGRTLQRTEAWMAASVRSEVEAGRVQLAALREGKDEAFRAVHEGAVLALIMATAAVTSESCPETLLLDLHRLQIWHAEFQFAVLATTTLAELQQGQKLPEHKEVAREVLGPVADFFAAHTPRSWDQQVVQKGVSTPANRAEMAGRTGGRRKRKGGEWGERTVATEA
jgi:hypothetical protein